MKEYLVKFDISPIINITDSLTKIILKFSARHINFVYEMKLKRTLTFSKNFQINREHFDSEIFEEYIYEEEQDELRDVFFRNYY